jgi:gliding motility-associated lipoprotein GldJ
MNKLKVSIVHFSMLLGLLFLDNACQQKKPTSESPGKQSTATGLEYDSDEGGENFIVKDFKGQPPAPNMIYIEGGRTVLGSGEEDVMFARDNVERTVTIMSFYMDETEIANIHWLEYMFYLRRDSSQNPDLYTQAIPDTNVWVKELSFNDPYRDHYLRYPGFRYYPVVGVSWEQATDYCRWRTNVVNYKLAQDADIEISQTGANGRIPLESGVVVPDYRLPTEAEWEYAAQALIGVQYGDENQTNRRLYPWDGHSLRNPYGRKMGQFLGNFKRGRGDYAGIAGKLNDGAMITDQVYAYPPNDFNLYNMAGNVKEWVMDVYRPLSYADVEDLNPLRRNEYKDPVKSYDKENSLIGNFTVGNENPSSMDVSKKNKQPRVYKGGSWADAAYWCSPGTRRYWAQDSSSSTIGFRCAMIQAGRNY